MIAEKVVTEINLSAQDYNEKVRLLNRLQKLNRGLPKYEYDTKPTPKRAGLFKTLPNHPTKKVASSNKRRNLELAVTQAIIDAKNAELRFNAAERKVYGKNYVR